MSGCEHIDEEIQQTLESGVATVIAAAAALPELDSLGEEIATVEAAAERGYFLPDEEEWVKLRYSQYLTLRARRTLLRGMEFTPAFVRHSVRSRLYLAARQSVHRRSCRPTFGLVEKAR